MQIDFVSVVKLIGLGIITALWMYFYWRERQFWILILGCIGLMVTFAQILPLRSDLQDLTALAYIFLGLIIALLARSFGYRPRFPL